MPGLPEPSSVFTQNQIDHNIYSLSQDSFGFVWIGTSRGLYKFDGVESEIFYIEDGLNSNWILSCVFIEKESIMMIGTSEGLNIYDYKTKNIKSVPKTDSNFDISNEWITGLILDQNDQLWIYNNGLHLYNFKNLEIESFYNLYDKDSDIITQAIIDNQNQNILWLGTANGLAKFNLKEKKYIAHYQQPKSENLNPFNDNLIELCLKQDKNGSIYGGLLNGGIFYLDAKSSKPIILELSCINKLNDERFELKQIHVLNDSIIFLITEKGIIEYQYEKKQCLSFLQSKRFKEITFVSLLQDRDNRIWLSGEDGLEVYDPKLPIFEAYNYTSFYNESFFIPKKIVHDTLNHLLYFIKLNGSAVYRFDLKKKKFLKAINLNRQDAHQYQIKTIDLLINNSNEVLLLGHNRIFKVLGESIYCNKELAVLDQPPYASFIEIENGDVLISSTYDGVIRIDKNLRLKNKYETNDFLSKGWWIYDIFKDYEHGYWFNQLERGFTYVDSSFKEFKGYPFREIENLDNYTIKDFLWLNETNLLICNSNSVGIINLSDNKYNPLDLNWHNIQVEEIINFAQDKEGNIWMLSSNGLIKSNSTLDKFQFFRINEEFKIQKRKISSQEGINFLKDNTLYYPNGSHLIFNNSNTIKQNLEQAKPRIKDFHLIKNSKRQVIDNVSSLKYYENNFEIEFSALGFTNAANNFYSYRVFPTQKEWSNFSKNRNIDLIGLIPGKYSLELRLANSDFIISPYQDKLNFQIMVPIWQRWWAILLLFFLFSLLVFLLMKNNKEKKENFKKQHEIKILNALIQGEEKEKARFSRDLHDSVGANLASLSMFMEALGKKLNIQGEKLHQQSVHILKNTFEEVRSISHNIGPVNLKSLAFEDAIGQLCHQSFYNLDIAFEIRFKLVENLLNENQKVNCFRIIQELIKNSIQHAKPKNFNIMIYSEQDYIIIEVSNDGLPFNVEELETSSGIGLKNIQYRINHLNGKLDISSNQNLTQFKIQIPINHNS